MGLNTAKCFKIVLLSIDLNRIFDIIWRDGTGGSCLQAECIWSMIGNSFHLLCSALRPTRLPDGCSSTRKSRPESTALDDRCDR